MGGRERLSPRDRLLALAVPVLLTLVALVAVERYHRVDQSPWQGIGWGMFASYEYLPARTARVTATVAGEEVPVPLPSDLTDDLDRVLVAPGDDNARTLAEQLRARTGADLLILEIWGHDVDTGSSSLRISFKLLRTVQVP